MIAYIHCLADARRVHMDTVSVRVINDTAARTEADAVARVKDGERGWGIDLPLWKPRPFTLTRAP